ncbi:Uncharacterised protein [Mycobacterium tuberculosis]|nr:Uncharacterised protein [Mycobacterium tuberculosis]
MPRRTRAIVMRAVSHAVNAVTRRVSSSCDIRPLTTSTLPCGSTNAYAGCWVTPKFAQTDPSVSASWVNVFTGYLLTNSCIAGT